METNEEYNSMLIDVHCHPFDLSRISPEAEEERKKLGVLILASACDLEEFEYCEKLENVLPCFAIHPQLCAAAPPREAEFKEQLILLDKLASEKRLAAIGEFGFDLYNEKFKSAEKLQDKIFTEHLENAVKYELPVILHVRRAMHKIFSYTNKLKKCKSVIFHSWPGTLEEGQSLLRRGVNAYFSFGNTIKNGHKKQVRCCSLLPAQRILTETDAPYQPLRAPSNQCFAGSRLNKQENYSSWTDLPKIIKTIACLRNINSTQMEAQIEANFNAFMHLCDTVQR